MTTRADELTKGKDGAILDTHARVQFEKGNLDKAIELQTKAIANADDANKAEMQEALDKYKQARANRMN